MRHNGTGDHLGGVSTLDADLEAGACLVLQFFDAEAGFGAQMGAEIGIEIAGGAGFNRGNGVDNHDIASGALHDGGGQLQSGFRLFTEINGADNFAEGLAGEMISGIFDVSENASPTTRPPNGTPQTRSNGSICGLRIDCNVWSSVRTMWAARARAVGWEIRRRRFT